MSSQSMVALLGLEPNSWSEDEVQLLQGADGVTGLREIGLSLAIAAW